nr:hypothetical protein [Tanacetum cinerariifolium]
MSCWNQWWQMHQRSIVWSAKTRVPIFAGPSLSHILNDQINLYDWEISEEEIEAAGCYCPLLKTLRLNQNAYGLNMRDDESITRQNAMAVKTLPALRHLKLIGNSMSG